MVIPKTKAITKSKLCRSTALDTEFIECFWAAY